MKANRFLLNLSVRVGLAISLAVPFVSVGDVSPVAACSGGAVPLPAARFDPAQQDENAVDIRDYGGIAFLGEVRDETNVVRAPFGPPTGSPVYMSNVTTVVALTDGVTENVRVGPSGFGAPDCSGGPRLFGGEKVMLFLYPSRPLIGYSDKEQGTFGDWQSGQFGVPILFDGDSAYYLSWGRFAQQGNGITEEQRQYVGRADEVLDLALDYFQINAQGRAQAFQFVSGHSDPGSTVIRPPAAGDGGLVR